MPFTYGLKNDALADDAGIEPHKILGLLGTAGLVGKTYYVDSTSSRCGSTQRHGTKTAPLATLAYAITNFSAANLAKATFVLLPGHAETISAVDGADLDIDAAHITVIGIGNGAGRPTISTSAVTSSHVIVSGNYVTLRNICIKCNVGNCADLLVVTGSDCIIDGCELTDTAGVTYPVTFLNIGTGAHRTVIKNCEVHATVSGGGSPAAGISIEGAVTGARILCNTITGTFTCGATAAPICSTAVAATGLVIANNVVRNLSTASLIYYGMSLGASVTGTLSNNRVSVMKTGWNGTDAVISVPAAVQCFENYVTDGDAVSGKLFPAAHA